MISKSALRSMKMFLTNMKIFMGSKDVYIIEHAVAEICNILLLQHRDSWLQLKYFLTVFKKNNLILSTYKVWNIVSTSV